MRKHFFLTLLFCVFSAGVAPAGQFRIAPPQDQRKRQPPRNYRESRLEIVNNDDRGYAIDVDYRRNRLEFVHRAKGDIFIPANSRITLTFDDDDDWRILGDHESLNIEIRSGRTTTLRLETRMNKRQVGLFGTVENGGRKQTKQLFKYVERPGRPQVHSPGPGSRPGQVVAQPPRPQPRQPTPPPPAPSKHGPQKGSSLGSVVGGVIDGFVDDKHGPGPRR